VWPKRHADEDYPASRLRIIYAWNVNITWSLLVLERFCRIDLRRADDLEAYRDRSDQLSALKCC
jgi:hypothetical protein